MDLEPRDNGYAGSACLFEADTSLPGTMVRITTENHEDRHQLALTPLPIWRDGSTIPPDVFRTSFPDVAFPKHVTATLARDGQALTASWKTDIGTNGHSRLLPSDGSRASELVPDAEVKDWETFKRYALGLKHRQFVFRGQAGPHRLRTSFHRTWRKDLGRFVDEDIPALRHALSGQTKHFFRHESALENAAFWNLLQHHGYPTPLLDWTYSPFVAAYFAFASFRPTPDVGEIVRIYVFDKVQWQKDWRAIEQVAYAPPHLTFIEALALDNPRALPQQALSTVTNCDDIESFIAFSGDHTGNSYLRCVDLPYDKRHDVLRELSTMGITAGTLFPGVEGTCSELKHRLFGFNF